MDHTKLVCHCWEAFPPWFNCHSLCTCCWSRCMQGSLWDSLCLEERDSAWHLRTSFLVAMSVCVLFMKQLQDKIYMKIHETWDQNVHMCFRRRVCRYSRACSLSSLCFKGITKAQICLVATSIAISGSSLELNCVPHALNWSLWLSPFCKYFLRATCYQIYFAALLFQPQAKCSF